MINSTCAYFIGLLLESAKKSEFGSLDHDFVTTNIRFAIKIDA